MRQTGFIIAVGMALGGCAQVERVFAPQAAPEAGAEPPVAETPAPVRPNTPDALDTVTPQERAAARREAATSAARDLGTTIASLGAPGEAGLWLKTPLVDVAGRGRVDYAPSGQSVAVDLIPLAAERGAGSQLSLAAFRAIEVPLTALPELRVYRLGE
ncbi:hypothetical protein [uncultured Roseovarius sp.]|uniref:hypothetical protein n=1 Tax=uncultured Roseovarius sp. TaxID=293344 RepID=UPI00260716F6|nr:hypothetical protein [uncultured Roseovarius sp.]